MTYVLAVDPGVTCGVAGLIIGRDSEFGFEVDWCENIEPAELYRRLHDAAYVDAKVVVEEFRLYPHMARQQAWSQMETCEVIGVVKYLCVRYDLDLYMQKALVKKPARGIAVREGMPMKDRMLGSGKGRYKGPDFDYTGPQHRRDALAHGVYWSFKNPDSPIYNPEY